MEPYRPLVDYKVYQLMQKNEKIELSPDIKQALATLLETSLINVWGEKSPVHQTMHHIAQGFCESLESKKVNLNYPQSIIFEH